MPLRTEINNTNKITMQYSQRYYRGWTLTSYWVPIRCKEWLLAFPWICVTVWVHAGRWMLGFRRTVGNLFMVQLLKEAHVQCNYLTLEWSQARQMASGYYLWLSLAFITSLLPKPVTSVACRMLYMWTIIIQKPSFPLHRELHRSQNGQTQGSHLPWWQKLGADKHS